MGFPGDSVVKNLSASAEDVSSIPGWGRSPEEGNCNPLQYSCLENPTERSLVVYSPRVCSATQLCSTLCDPMDFSPPASSVHGISQTRILGLGGSDGKESDCNARDLGWIFGLGRLSWRRKWQPIQCSCLENSMDREAWQATVHGVTNSRTQLSN